MLRKILVLADENQYRIEKEILNENGFEWVFEKNENIFIEKVISQGDIDVVFLFHTDEDNYAKYDYTLGKLMELEKMKNISVFSVFDSFDSLRLETIRSIDDFIMEPANISEIVYRLNRLRDTIAMTEKYKDEIDEAILMYEAMARLVATVVFKVNEKAEPYAEQVQMYTSFISRLYHEKYPERLSISDLKIIDTLVLLHDIGIIYIDQDIVYVDRELTREEALEFRRHSLVGGRVFRTVKEKVLEKYNKTPLFLEKAIEFAEYHHEYCDGSGYPFGLKKEGIPLYARLISCAQYLVDESETPDKILETIFNMNDKSNEKMDKDITQLMLGRADELVEIAKIIEMKQGNIGR